MNDDDRTYRTPLAFRTALVPRLKSVAKDSSRTYAQVKREFLLQRFLARVFTDESSSWVLKGGTALLVRLPDARFSRDIDLLNTRTSVDEALLDLERAAAIAHLDPFHFALAEPKILDGARAGAQVVVTAYLGTTVFGRFPIHLTTGLQPTGDVEHQSPRPIVAIDDVTPPPTFALYPLPDKIADKVCAMYELHGTSRTVSSRYHDLVDLVLIVTSWQINAGATRAALTAEASRRNLALPDRLVQCGHGWKSGYAKIARETGFSAERQQVEVGLDIVGACLDPLLTGTVSDGEWEPTTSRWL